MRVVVLGGYGVFGSRLARLLVRDGHDVWIAGRDAAQAAACATRIGGRALVVDRDGDLAPVLAAEPRILVDAAGPFQAYGDDPYRLVRFCLDHGIDYLDLSDDGAFTAGIVALDAAARRAGRFALSGASSVPALSAAATAALAADLDTVAVIEAAILPGNRAPRGRSVIAAILSQIGRPLHLWRGGTWWTATGWSDRRAYHLDGGLVRTGRLIGAPDLTLFPDHFAARSVIFRAGMELGIMNVGLAVLAWLRRHHLVPGTRWLVTPAHWLATLLEPFGTDRGGMVVEVTGTADGQAIRRSWRLLAEAGDGPFVPGTAVRALLRRADRIEPGARPCLSDLTLEEAERAMGDLAVTTRRAQEARPPLFQTVLGDRWATLPPTLRRLHSVHDVERFSGIARVDRGGGLLARLAAWFFRFPSAGEGVPVTVTKIRTEAGEIWQRRFAGRVFRSRCTASRPHHFRERFGPFTFELELPVKDGALHYPARRGWVCGLPLPRALMPRSDTREFEADGVFHFDVALSAPLGGGLIVRYRGVLAPDAG